MNRTQPTQYVQSSKNRAHIKATSFPPLKSPKMHSTTNHSFHTASSPLCSRNTSSCICEMTVALILPLSAVTLELSCISSRQTCLTSSNEKGTSIARAHYRVPHSRPQPLVIAFLNQCPSNCSPIAVYCTRVDSNKTRCN